jgi:hypothetical protein
MEALMEVETIGKEIVKWVVIFREILWYLQIIIKIILKKEDLKKNYQKDLKLNVKIFGMVISKLYGRCEKIYILKEI